MRTKQTMLESDLELTLLELFRQYAPTTIKDIIRLLPNHDIDDIVGGVAKLFAASKLEPVNSAGLGYAGALNCQLRPTATL